MSKSDPKERRDEDAKAWFYLDHREDIEAWVALRSAGRDLMDQFLVREANEVEEWAEEFAAEYETASLESGSTPRFGLRRARWDRNGLAAISVVIEWERARLLAPGSNEWPYIAIRWPAELATEDSRRVVNDALKPVRAQLSGHSGRGHPFWRYIKPSPGPALDPQTLALDAVQGLRELWSLAAPILDDLRLDLLPTARPLSAE